MASLGEIGRQWVNREEFVPASDWNRDANANYLFLHLPGFRKEQMRLELASTGHIIISGERIVNDNKSIYFQQSFALPENANMDKINGKFDGDFLHVTVPRRSSVVEENKQQQRKNENHTNSVGDHMSVNEETDNRHGENSSKHEEQHGNHEKQHGPLEMATKFFKKNKGVIVSVFIAFSVGVLVCGTLEIGGE